MYWVEIKTHLHSITKSFSLSLSGCRSINIQHRNNLQENKMKYNDIRYSQTHTSIYYSYNVNSIQWCNLEWLFIGVLLFSMHDKTAIFQNMLCSYFLTSITLYGPWTGYIYIYGTDSFTCWSLTTIWQLVSFWSGFSPRNNVYPMNFFYWQQSMVHGGGEGESGDCLGTFYQSMAVWYQGETSLCHWHTSIV